MNGISKMTRAAVSCMAVALVSGVWAETWTDSAGYTWTYRISGNSAEINNGYSTAISPRPYGAVTVPSSLGGKPVTSIGVYAFEYCRDLTSVTIPDNVTSIGDYAFSDCRGLTSVTIPDSVTSIGGEAFSDCSELVNVVIGSGVTSIGNYAFEYCRKLKSVEFKGNAPPYCYNSVFYGIASGCEVIVPRNSTGWGVREGELWHGLVLRYASNVKWEIVNGELRGVELNGETDIRIPSSVTSIGNNAFRYCHYNLSSVTMPDSVTSIDERAFEGCYGLKSVAIGNGVTSIGREVFYNCSSLTNVMIGNSVTSIGYRAFYGCGGLTSVTIPNSVTSIGERAFDYCHGLKSVTIGNRVTNIGNYAFLTCSSLTSITIPASVVCIGKGAFAECFNLTSVLFLGSLPDCGSGAFNAVANHMNVANGCLAYVNDSETFPKDGDIWNNLTIRKIPLPRDADSLTRVAFAITDNGELTHVALNGSTFVLIPRSVMRIRSDAFDDCRDMTTVLIPSSVTSINGMFRNCLNLTNAVIIASAMSINGYRLRIEDSMLRDCDNLTSVRIGHGITSIGYRAFSGCRGLTSVLIPDSVTSIGDSAFYNCSGLASVTIPDSVTNIGNQAFSGCSGLSSMTIPDGVTSIGDSAFKGCSGLMSITVDSGNANYKSVNGLLLSKDSKTLIQGVNGDVTIPDSVTSIGNSAFYNCSGLKSVTLLGNAPAVNSSTFYGVNSSCVASVSPKSTGWGVGVGEKWNGLTLQYWPEVLTAAASDAEVGEIMAAFSDKGLAAQVSTVAEYDAFRSWVSDNNLYQPNVVESTRTWLSYALGADALIGKEITSNDVRIVAFETANADSGAMGSSRPTFAFEVAIDNVNIGGGMVAVETLKENLKKVLGVEGAATLSPDGFSSDNIEITFDTPIDGKARFTVTPLADADNSFFMRVKVK